jgi:hypothetical protein
MLFEIVSSIAAGGLVGYTYLNQSGGTSEAAKIQRIAANCGLVVKEKGATRTIQLLRKSKHRWGTEYAYRIPLGLSFMDFERKRDHLQDGLNNKHSILEISLDDVKNINLRGNIIQQIRDILAKKQKISKTIEMEYDGLLKIKVYKNGLSEFIPFDDSLFNRCNDWEVPIGFSMNEFIPHNFDTIPHMIVAGATRYGKSVFLKSVITSLIHRKPNEVKFTLIDLKGGLAFNRFRNLSQVETVAKDVDEALEALKQIRSSMKLRQAEFLAKGYEDIKEASAKERHFIIVDEAAELSSPGEVDKETRRKKVECESVISEIARIGGGIGYRLLYCTQYPTNETLRSQVRQNCGARLCFLLETSAASLAVLDETGAESLPLIKGRGIYRTDRKQIVQTPFITNDFIDKTIKPHITMKPRKDEKNGIGDQKREERRRNTLVIEETGLS